MTNNKNSGIYDKIPFLVNESQYGNKLLMLEYKLASEGYFSSDLASWLLKDIEEADQVSSNHSELLIQIHINHQMLPYPVWLQVIMKSNWQNTPSEWKITSMWSSTCPHSFFIRLARASLFEVLK